MHRPDDVLSPFELIPFDSLPKAGALELHGFNDKVSDQRYNIAVFASLSAMFGMMLWVAWISWLPAAVIAVMCGLSAASAGMAAKNFLALVGGRRAYKALPEGSSEKMAEAEDRLASLIYSWNGAAAEWNRKAVVWYADAVDWRRQRDEPIMRQGGWTEGNSELSRQALCLELDALYIERHDLSLRRAEIDRESNSLRLQLLEGSESPEQP